MKFAHALLILIIGCIFNFTDVCGQGIAQTSFVIPKPASVILNALTSEDRSTFLLSQGLDEKLEEDFPSGTSSVKEVFVRVFAKIFGIVSHVAPVIVVREDGQT